MWESTRNTINTRVFSLSNVDSSPLVKFSDSEQDRMIFTQYFFLPRPFNAIHPRFVSSEIFSSVETFLRRTNVVTHLYTHVNLYGYTYAYAYIYTT